MPRGIRLSAALLVGLAVAAPAAAQSTPASQDRPFLFSVSTPRTETPHVTLGLDTGFGERAFDVDQDDGFEQRIGIRRRSAKRRRCWRARRPGVKHAARASCAHAPSHTRPGRPPGMSA